MFFDVVAFYKERLRLENWCFVLNELFNFSLRKSMCCKKNKIKHQNKKRSSSLFTHDYNNSLLNDSTNLELPISQQAKIESIGEGKNNYKRAKRNVSEENPISKNCKTFIK